ncbi:hypothetical protein WJX73_002657 [Symbiochloris irregularis]|uniref:tRNA/rRNA methyltransferase SpoU type domain-containing protein n=1 Tax=Symbiochloris irregularis TaxID=706552 RepID=A0AAW1PN43_9CHLO
MQGSSATLLTSAIHHLANAHASGASLLERQAAIGAVLSLTNVPKRRSLHDLQQLCASLAVDDNVDLTLGAVAAVLFLCNDSAGAAHLDSFTQLLFIPILLSRGSDLEAWQAQVAEALLDLLARHGCWRSAMGLLSFCAQSMTQPQTGTVLTPEVTTAVQQAEAAAEFSALPSGNKADMEADQRLAFPVSCMVVRCVISAAARASSEHDFSPSLLSSPSQAVWELSRDLSADESKQATALAILAQCWHLYLPSEHPAALDIRAHAAFWALLRACLVSRGAGVRKKAVWLLQKALPGTAPNQPPWSAFFALYNVLDEFAIHLIADIWHAQMELLHPCAPASETGDESQGPLLDAAWMEALSAGLVTEQLLVCGTLPHMLSSGSRLTDAPQALHGFLRLYLAGSSLSSLDHAQGASDDTGASIIAKASSQDTALQQILQELRTDLLELMRVVITKVKTFRGLQLQETLCTQIVNAAAILAPAAAVPLTTVQPLLAEIPLPILLAPDAPVANLVTAWLAHQPGHLYDQVMQLADLYLSSEGPGGNQLPVTSAEIDAWRTAADRLARVYIFLPSTLEAHQRSFLVTKLQHAVARVQHRPYLPRGYAERTLLLIPVLWQGACKIFWQPVGATELAKHRESVPLAMGADSRSRLSVQVLAALNRAEVAMQCLGACLAALSARSVLQKQQEAADGAGPAINDQSVRLSAACTKLQDMAKGFLHMLAMNPICRHTEDQLQAAGASNVTNSGIHMDGLMKVLLPTSTQAAVQKRTSSEVRDAWRTIAGILALPEAHREASPRSALSGQLLARLLRAATDALDCASADATPALLDSLGLLMKTLLVKGPGIASIASLAYPDESTWSANNAAQSEALQVIVQQAVQAAWAAFLDRHKQPLHVHSFAEKRPRAMAVLALHLCPLLLSGPSTVAPHAALIQQLLLYSADDESLVAGSALSEDIATGNLAARMAAVSCMHQLAVMAGLAGPGSDAAPIWLEAEPLGNAAAAREAGEVLWSSLFHEACSNPAMAKGACIVGTAVYRLRVRAWQALAVLSAFVRGADAAAVIQQLWILLKVDNPASIRQFMESVIVRLLLRQPWLTAPAVLPLLNDHVTRADSLPSAVLVAGQVCRQCLPTVRAQLLPRLLPAIYPWMLCHHHGARTFAQLVVRQLLRLYPDECGLLPDDIPVTSVLAFLDSNADFQRLVNCSGGPFDDLSSTDVEAACSPQGVFSMQSQEPGTSHNQGSSGATKQAGPLRAEAAPLPLMERIGIFLTAERLAMRQRRDDSAADADPLPTRSPARTGEAELHQRKYIPDLSGQQRSQAASSRPDPLAEVLHWDPAEEIHPTAAAKKAKGLILAASLLDKAPNLAGLARSAEALGAEALTIPDLKLTKTPLFESVSVTAQHWVDMREVPVKAFIPWLRQRQAEGYKVVGLEQMEGSVPLPEYQFSPATVLVVGREREGIPEDVLQVLDGAVEIPQMGVIRSLNAHVSGAIAMYEYRRQMRE